MRFWLLHRTAVTREFYLLFILKSSFIKNIFLSVCLRISWMVELGVKLIDFKVSSRFYNLLCYSLPLFLIMFYSKLISYTLYKFKYLIMTILRSRYTALFSWRVTKGQREVTSRGQRHDLYKIRHHNLDRLQENGQKSRQILCLVSSGTWWESWVLNTYIEYT